MKLKDSIIESIRNYPVLYKSENFEKSSIIVLNHLFFVNGNGYEWFDGYLVENLGEIIPEPYGMVKEEPLPGSFFTDRTDCIYDNYKYKPYPLCEYAELNNIPENIRPDWLEGAIKIATIALNYYREDEAIKEISSQDIPQIYTDFKNEQIDCLNKFLAVRQLGANNAPYIQNGNRGFKLY